jgi:hypothetical protein
MQCYGGGMIDELDRAYNGETYPPVAYTAASESREEANAGNEDPHSGGKWESYYNQYYSGKIGGALGAPPTPEDRTARGAAEDAYNDDYWGPVAAPARGKDPDEHPQYHASSQGDAPDYISMADTITLHRSNANNPYKVNRFLAILWGGSTVDNANWNGINRMHTDLVARGYSEDEMYILYPGGPGGGRPAWIDDGTNYQDMADAWNWVAGQSENLLLTQVFFWSSTNHGTQPQNVNDFIIDTYGAPPQNGEQYYFDVPITLLEDIQAQYEYFSAQSEPNGLPYFQITTTQTISDLSVVLNNRPLLLDEVLTASANGETQFVYKFALDATDVSQLSPMGDSVRFLASGPLDFVSAGLTTGHLANSIPLPVPEPATLALLALGTLALALCRSRW